MHNIAHWPSRSAVARKCSHSQSAPRFPRIRLLFSNDRAHTAQSENPNTSSHHGQPATVAVPVTRNAVYARQLMGRWLEVPWKAWDGEWSRFEETSTGMLIAYHGHARAFEIKFAGPSFNPFPLLSWQAPATVRVECRCVNWGLGRSPSGVRGSAPGGVRGGSPGENFRF